MDTDDDLLSRVRPKSTLLDMKPPVRRPDPDTEWETSPDIPALDDMVPLPQPGDSYKAFARPDNKSLLMIRFLLQDGTVEGFAYCDMRKTRITSGDDPGAGPVLLLKFDDTEVRIEGRKLDGLANLVHFHRVSWMRELPPGKMIHEKNAPVITRITITELKH